MQKLILFLLTMIASTYSYADGIDKISFYVNSTLITTTSDMRGKELKLDVNKGDTIKLVVITDWGGHLNSTIDILNRNGEIIKSLKPILDKTYEKTFLLLNIDKNLLNDSLTFVLNYNPKTVVKPWNFALITIRQNEGSH